MTQAKWLDGYSGQTVGELLAMAPEYRTPEWAGAIVKALRDIGCGATADIAQKAVDRLGIAGPPSADAVSAALERAGPDLVEVLGGECDGPFYEAGEPIADKLFDYIGAHRGRIRLG